MSLGPFLLSRLLFIYSFVRERTFIVFPYLVRQGLSSLSLPCGARFCRCGFVLVRVPAYRQSAVPPNIPRRTRGLIEAEREAPPGEPFRVPQLAHAMQCSWTQLSWK